MTTSTRGTIEALLSTTFFGLIPFFTLPLYEQGMNTASIVFWRFLFASFAAGINVLYRKEKLAISFNNSKNIAFIAFLYQMAAIALFYSLTLMPSGIVTTIFFVNPLFVMLFMVLFFKEKLELYQLIFSIIAIFGVALLSGFFSDLGTTNVKGVGASILSGVIYAVFVIAMQKSQTKAVNAHVMSFYLFIFTGIFAFIYALSTGEFMFLSSPYSIFMTIGLGVITAFLSNFLLISSLQKISTILVSILGVTEPLTAVFVGIVVFNEPFTMTIAAGVAIVILSISALTAIPLLRQKV